MKINKPELVNKLAKEYGYTKKNADVILDDVLGCILTCMSEGHTVALHGFGIFEVVEQKEREGRNPKTGETFFVPAKMRPKFTPGRGMRNAAKIYEGTYDPEE